MALLDAFDTEQGRFGLGLLAMAQPSRMSDGERMLGALQMLDQFKAQRSAAEERKADREERARVRALQEQQIQMQLEAARRQQARESAADAYRASLIPGGDGIGPTRPFDPLTAATILPSDQVSQLMQIQEAQRKAQQQEQIQNVIRRAVSPVQPIEANAASGVAGPRPEALAAVGQRRPIDFQQLIAMGVPESMAKALAEAPNYGRPKIAREVKGNLDGKPVTFFMDDYGNVMGNPVPEWKDKVQMDLGGQIALRDPVTQQMQILANKTQTPDSMASNAVNRQRLMWEMGKPQFQEGQWVYPPSAANPSGVALTPSGMTPNSKGTDDLRKEFAALPEVKAFKEVAPTFATMIEASKRNTPQADINLVYGLAKIFDPASVVREGEYATIEKSQAIPEWLKAQAQHLRGGGKLSPETRMQMVSEAATRTASFKTAYDSARNSYEGIVAKRGLDPTQVFSDINIPGVKFVNVDNVGMVAAMRGADGKYYVKRGNKTYRVEE